MIEERNFSDEQTIMSLQAAKGAGTAVDVHAYRHKKVTVIVSGMASSDAITVKLYGTESSAEPTWVDGSDDPATVTSSNKYFPVALKDIDSGSTIAGSTGVVLVDAAGNGATSYEFNDNGSIWLNALVTTYSVAGTGAITINVSSYND